MVLHLQRSPMMSDSALFPLPLFPITATSPGFSGNEKSNHFSEACLASGVGDTEILLITDFAFLLTRFITGGTLPI